MVRLLLILFLFTSCIRQQIARHFPTSKMDESYTGNRFFELAKSYTWQQRDSLAIDWFRKGAIPSFWKKFVPITVSSKDSLGNKVTLKYWVSPDYFVLGTDADWVRVPITPMAAQRMLDETNCALPTRKMVDDIYVAASVKLAPIPMYAFRDSGITMYQHHLMIEGQRKGRKGMIAGIKKDVVMTYKIQFGQKQHRVAIYGWHQINGKPIQPLYTGHVDWYVDYSHGVRFVSNQLKLNGKVTTMEAVLNDVRVQKILCNEDTCGYFKYPVR